MFAGVGGFRLGLEGWKGKSASSNYKKLLDSNYEIVWSNQWEPSTKVQHAATVYKNKFGQSGHSNQDISTVEVSQIPDHDLLVGGFPCQDIDQRDLDKWAYLKGPKKEIRKNVDGFEYNYSEGGMVFPDSLDKPSRTIITGEGGKSPSRFKHVIQTSNGYRRLSPVELERLNMFPDDHTKLEGVSDTKRAFFMGNALVVGVIEKIGISLMQKIRNEVTV